MNTSRVIGLFGWALLMAAGLFLFAAAWPAIVYYWQRAREEMHSLRREAIEAEEREAMRRAR